MGNYIIIVGRGYMDANITITQEMDIKKAGCKSRLSKSTQYVNEG